MFDKVIEFTTHEDYFKCNEDFPVPIKLNIPEWFKKLKTSEINQTIKSCIPFLDSLTTGYSLKMPQDFYINHNVDSLDNKGEKIKDSFCQFPMHQVQSLLFAKSLNFNTFKDTHPTSQLEGSPFIEKNKNLPFYKILNPWFIKTPPGYSCLFVPPLNNTDDRFSIISAIVDTDTFSREINFPIVINGDKYPVLETTIKKGTPYVQVIPFKRDNWKMSIKPKKQNELTHRKIFYELEIFQRYKNKYWSKKLWK
jgi:hypothetical protein